VPGHRERLHRGRAVRRVGARRRLSWATRADRRSGCSLTGPRSPRRADRADRPRGCLGAGRQSGPSEHRPGQVHEPGEGPGPGEAGTT
jgi:hypothetical protein